MGKRNINGIGKGMWRQNVGLVNSFPLFILRFSLIPTAISERACLLVKSFPLSTFHASLFALHFSLFTLFICAGTVFAQAPKLHAVLVGDINNVVTGKGHRANIEKMRNEIDTIASYSGFQKSVLEHDLAQFDKGTFDALVNGLVCGPEDVLLFYYSGEEYIAAIRNNTSTLAKIKDGYLALNVIKTRFASRKAKFSLILVEMCNNPQTEKRVFPGLKAASKEKYVALFYDAKGVVMLNNHVAREQSGVKMEETGSYFTHSFLEALHLPFKDDQKWEFMAKNTLFKTVKLSLGAQNPQYYIKLETEGNDINPAANTNKTKRPSVSLNTTKAENLNTNKSDRDFEAQVEAEESEAEQDALNMLSLAEGGDVLPNKLELEKTSFLKDNAEKNPKSGDSEAGSPSEVSFKGKVRVKEAGDAKPVFTPKQLAEYQKEGSAKVVLLQDKITEFSKGIINKNELLKRVMELFVDANQEVEVSNISGGKERKKASQYFGKLHGLGKQYTVELVWYKDMELSGFVQRPRGDYQATAVLFQEFRKTDKKGRLVYADRVEKQVQVLLQPNPEQPDPSKWRVKIGSIKVIEGTTKTL